MGLDPGRVWDLAVEVLAVVEDGYSAAAVPLPDRRYVSAGTPAYDCDQLVIWVARLGSHAGDPAADFTTAVGAHPAMSLRYAELNVTLLRCVPVVELDDQGGVILPSVLEEERAAELVLHDSLRIWQTLLEGRARLTTCNSLAWAGWASDPPEGGLAGGTLTLRAGLE